MEGGRSPRGGLSSVAGEYGSQGTPYVGGKSGVALWQANCGNIDVQGSGDTFVKGIYYAPCTSLTYHGNPSAVLANHCAADR